MRIDLSRTERIEHVARRKELYLERFSDTKWGGRVAGSGRTDRNDSTVVPIKGTHFHPMVVCARQSRWGNIAKDIKNTAFVLLDMSAGGNHSSGVIQGWRGEGE